MSALAARRAAAAASAASSPAPQEQTAAQVAVESSTPGAGPSKRTAKHVHDSPATSRDSTPKAGQSKRRRIASREVPVESDAARKPPKREVEVYTAPEKQAATVKRKAKRAFSPSRPVEDYDEVSSADGRDSSEDEQGFQVENGAADGRMERGMEWSVPSTPVQTPGPSRNFQLATRNSKGYAKTFNAVDGINVRRLPASAVGLEGEEEGLLVALGPNETLMLSGSYSIAPLSGSINLLSTTLRPSQPLISYAVFAPLSNPLPIIAASSSSSTAPDSPYIKLLNGPIDPSGAVVFLHQLSTGVEGLSSGAIPTFSTAFPGRGFKGVWELPPEPCYPYSSPPSWEKALDTLRSPRPANGQAGTVDHAGGDEKPPIVLVKGPKRSGKSSFGKAALNSLLERYTKVAWLECDLGQGEFSAGGVVGLWIIDQPVLGPPFTHPRIPARAHFMGTYTPITCPDEYLAAIHHLVEHFKYELQYPLDHSSGEREGKRSDVVPLVVNTPGWIKGLGEDLLRSIEGMTNPTHTFQFPLSASSELEDRSAGWTTSPPVSYAALPADTTNGSGVVMELEPAPVLPLQARYTASDHRSLSTLAYFYSRLPSPTSSKLPNWDFSTPLACQAPYEVAIGETIKEIYLIGEGADGILAEDLLLALNGSIVAFLERREPSVQETTETYVQGRPVPALDETNFLGYGFIRGLCVGQPMKLHLLTPLLPDTLTRVSILVRNGALEMPNPGLLDFRLSPQEQGKVPFFDDGPIGVGGERRRIRRNVMRKGA